MMSVNILRCARVCTLMNAVSGRRCLSDFDSQKLPHFGGEIAEQQDPPAHLIGQVRNLQRQVTSERGRYAVFEVAAELGTSMLMGTLAFLRTTAQRGLDFAYQTLRATDGEVGENGMWTGFRREGGQPL